MIVKDLYVFLYNFNRYFVQNHLFRRKAYVGQYFIPPPAPLCPFSIQ